MTQPFESFFPWLDGLPPERKHCVAAKWRQMKADGGYNAQIGPWIDWCAETQGFVPPPPTSFPAAPDPPPQLRLGQAHPAFQAWHAHQTAHVRAAIASKWLALQNDPTIAHGSAMAEHAMLNLLLHWCSERYGYARRA